MFWDFRASIKLLLVILLSRVTSQHNMLCPGSPRLQHTTICHTLSPSPKGIVFKCSWTYCGSHYRFSSTTNSLLFFASLPFQFPLSAPSSSLLPSFSPFLYFSPLSPRPLLSPGGMRQARRLAVCAAVMAWAPYLRILWWCWGLFILFVGRYTTVTQHQQHQQHHMHIQTYTQLHQYFLLRNFLLFPLPHFDVWTAVVIKIL